MARVTIIIEDGSVVTNPAVAEPSFYKMTLDKLDAWMRLSPEHHYKGWESRPARPAKYRCSLYKGGSEVGFGEGKTPACAIAVALMNVGMGMADHEDLNP